MRCRVVQGAAGQRLQTVDDGWSKNSEQPHDPILASVADDQWHPLIAEQLGRRVRRPCLHVHADELIGNCVDGSVMPRLSTPS